MQVCSLACHSSQSQHVQEFLDPQEVRPQLQHAPIFHEASFHDPCAKKPKQVHYFTELSEASRDKIMKEVLDAHDRFATAPQLIRILQQADLQGALAAKIFRPIHVPCCWLLQVSGKFV